MANKWWNLPANNTELFNMAKSTFDGLGDWIKKVDEKATLDEITERMIELARYDDWNKSMSRSYVTPRVIEDLWNDYKKTLKSVGWKMDEVRAKYYQRYPTKEMQARDKAGQMLNGWSYDVLWNSPTQGGNARLYFDGPIDWNYYWFNLSWAKLDNLDIDSKIKQATEKWDKATVKALNSIKNGKTPYSSWNIQDYTIYWFIAPEDAPNKNWVHAPAKLVSWDPYVWWMDNDNLYVVNLKTKESNKYPKKINVWKSTDVNNVDRFKNIVSTFTSNYYKWDTTVPVLDSLYDEEDYAHFQWIPYTGDVSTYSERTRVPSSNGIRKLY